uniref:40S ribosomal protein S8 n=1 Tax=Trepomonas sp. PC1 TaxID=1076344 RepID=A0A146K620_9EUKA|eukprot:JAP92067.1 Ribosomal protein S8 [Trepomonas sp. PC1]
MGLTNDKMFKRRSTGGLRTPWHKKRNYQMGRPAANTRVHIMKASNTQVKKDVDPKKVTIIRCRGGNYKFRALRLLYGNFSWAGVNFSTKSSILSVCYNSTSNELVRTNTLVKSCIVYIDATPFKAALENKEKKLEEKQLQHHTQMDENVVNQIKEGRLLAKISTRPGQSGRADGYILEGPELTFYQKKLASK